MYLMIVAICILCISFGNAAVTTAAESISVTREHVVIIDAGHGGEDGGATSCAGYLESEINLSIALRLNDLCHLLGLDTVMIRTSDISVYTEGKTLAAKKASDLRQRVNIVNSYPNGILVSIHQNTFSDSRYYGAQVFYAATDGSKELAESMQIQFNEVDPKSSRQVKASSGVYLMQHIKKTGVLIECGFLSNPEEEAKLRNSDYQKRLCGVIVSALSAYISA